MRKEKVFREKEDSRMSAEYLRSAFKRIYVAMITLQVEPSLKKENRMVVKRAPP